MLLHDGLTHIQSQMKPRLLSGKSSTLLFFKFVYKDKTLCDVPSGFQSGPDMYHSTT